MYDVANAGRSGTALCVLPQKSLTPKIFHLTVSHQNIIANNSVYKLYKITNAIRNGDRFFIHRTEIFDFVVR